MPKKTTTKPIPRKISQADLLTGAPLDLLRRKLLEVRADRELARSKGSFSAVASLHRLEAEILKHAASLHTATAQVDPLDALSDEELEALASGEAPSTQEVEPPEAPSLRLVGAR